MIALVVVTVLLNGVPVPAARPARIIAGVVMAPLDPIVRRFARATSFDPASGAIAIVAHARRVRLTIDAREARVGERSQALAVAPFAADATAFVPLAELVRMLGGAVTFDSVRKVLEIALAEEGPVTTPSPYNPDEPRVPAHAVFTAEPLVTPRPQLSGDPRPRRTPIPVRPSQP